MNSAKFEKSYCRDSGEKQNLGNLFFLINFYWSILALQCCVSFYCTAKWISYTLTYIPSLFRFPSHLGHHRALSRVPCALQLSILCITVYVYQSQSPNSSYPPPPTLVSIHLFSTSVSQFCRQYFLSDARQLTVKGEDIGFNNNITQHIFVIFPRDMIK